MNQLKERIKQLSDTQLTDVIKGISMDFREGADTVMSEALIELEARLSADEFIRLCEGL